MRTISISRVRNCLLGLALGDAMGAPTEFLDYSQIASRYPCPNDLLPSAHVTDDTQMALAVGDAIIDCGPAIEPLLLARRLSHHFVAWSRSPDNNRAPGMTCMTACERLRWGKPWLDATQTGSKGCGANMRVAPIPLAAAVTRDQIGAASQLQAAVTHGHATGLAAAELTAIAIRMALDGEALTNLPAQLLDHARSQRTVYHECWLHDLWQRAGGETPATYISRGWDECIVAIERVDAARASLPISDDPCRHTGEGWIAEEALATALLCVSAQPSDPIAVLRMAARTSGDSDSIACIAGAITGAAHEVSPWPGGWVEAIEYRDHIERMANQLVHPPAAAREPAR